jgi:hypothetical protein
MYHVVDNSPVSRRVRSPSWLDLRLVAGVGLILACVLIGVRVVASADHTAHYWSADHDLSAGVILQASDLHSVAARLPTGSSGYFAASADLVGQAVSRPIRAGELVPKSAIAAAGPATTVTIPLGADDAPRISAGQRVTVWVSTALCPTAVVLADVAVQSVQSSRSGALAAGGGEDIVVRVSPTLAQRVIEALAIDGGQLRAGVLDGAPTATGELTELSECVAPKAGS